MSTHVKAFIPDSDPLYLKHKKVLIACVEADVEFLPNETAAYFMCNIPDMCLLEEKLEIQLKEKIHFTLYRKDDEEGFEVNLKDIPEGVTKLRFYNSW